MPEFLFNPQLAGFSGIGIHELIQEAITACDIDLRPHLYNNIIVSGGSTLFPGFVDRLSSELVQLAPSVNSPLLLFKLTSVRRKFVFMHLEIPPKEDFLHGLEDLSLLPWVPFTKCGCPKKNGKSMDSAL